MSLLDSLPSWPLLVVWGGYLGTMIKSAKDFLDARKLVKKPEAPSSIVAPTPDEVKRFGNVWSKFDTRYLGLIAFIGVGASLCLATAEERYRYAALAEARTVMEGQLQQALVLQKAAVALEEEIKIRDARLVEAEKLLDARNAQLRLALDTAATVDEIKRLEAEIANAEQSRRIAEGKAADVRKLASNVERSTSKQAEQVKKASSWIQKSGPASVLRRALGL